MKVYLAGPEVFAFEAEKRFAEMRALCGEHGIEALTPMDHQMVDPGAAEIYQKNIELIVASDLIIANISPFRGIGVDSGTAFEIGYAAALGKPVVVWTNDNRDLTTRTAGAFGGNLRRGEDRKLRDPSGDEVEDFSLAENLMIAVPATTGDRPICNDFASAVKQASEILKA